MSDPIVLYEVKDSIAYIVMNRPEKRNALNVELCAALGKIWERFEQDPDARVAILSGAGKTFCAGFDLAQGPEAEEEARALGVANLPETLTLASPAQGVTVFKPIIAAVHGWASGAGYALATSCDLTIAAENARFAFPEPRVGIVGRVAEYAPYMPFKIMMEFMLTGQPMTAQRAYEVGLVNKVVPEEELMTEATKWAEILKKNAPLTLKAIKYGLYKAMYSPAIAARRDNYNFIRPQLQSEDIKEGARAFIEGREPRFTGK